MQLQLFENQIDTITATINHNGRALLNDPDERQILNCFSKDGKYKGNLVTFPPENVDNSCIKSLTFFSLFKRNKGAQEKIAGLIEEHF